MDLPDPLQLPGSGLSAPHVGVLTHHCSALAVVGELVCPRGIRR